MKFLTIFVLAIIFFSCANKSNDLLNTLPTLDENFIQDNLKKRIDLSEIDFGKKLIKDDIEKINGIARFEIIEDDTIQRRPFEIILIETLSKTGKKQMIVSINKTDKSIIDIFQFNPDTLRLDEIYLHSSELDKNKIAIAVEFVEIEKAPNEIYIFGHSIEVSETGKIEYISKYENFEETFNRLPRTKKYTGIYKYESEDGLEITFDIKDATKRGFYAYEFSISTPKGCNKKFTNLECNFSNKVIRIDTIDNMKIVLDIDKVKIINSNFKSDCDEKLKLDYEMKKIEK